MLKLFRWFWYHQVEAVFAFFWIVLPIYMLVNEKYTDWDRKRKGLPPIT